MNWSRGKIIVTAVAALVVVIAVITIARIERRRHSMWDVVRPDSALLQNTPPQATMVPTKFAWGTGWVRDGDRMIGIGAQLRDILQTAYQWPGARTVILADLPPVRYDFITNTKNDPLGALQNEIKRETGLVGRRETREVDVLLLMAGDGLGPDLKVSDEASSAGAQYRDGELFWSHQSLSALAQSLEQYLNTPVLDETDLAGNYDFHLKWKWPRDAEGVKRDVGDRLGLRLMPAKRSIEVLVIEQTRK
jgi:uncharacterized protein (TIGR03435 family)